MFLLYINDICTKIDSSIRLFTDDCILYRIIKTTEDHNYLQDLNTLVEWTKQWQMIINVLLSIFITIFGYLFYQ